jgi:hypothetical protein
MIASAGYYAESRYPEDDRWYWLNQTQPTIVIWRQPAQTVTSSYERAETAAERLARELKLHMLHVRAAQKLTRVVVCPSPILQHVPRLQIAVHDRRGTRRGDRPVWRKPISRRRRRTARSRRPR